MKYTAISLFAFLTLPLLGQHNSRAVRNLQFRFENPGARSLGIGGAFTGMADDATAVLANPAGITQLRKASFNIETSLVQTRFDIPFYGGSIVQTNLFDFDFNLETQSLSERNFQIPFASYVIPFERLTLGVYYNLQTDVKRSYRTESIAVFPLDHILSEVEYYPTEDQVDIRIQNLGFTIAHKFAPTFSGGVSLTLSRMEYLTRSTIFSENSIGEPIPSSQEVFGDDTSFGLIAGFLYQPNDWLSAGISYHLQPKFDTKASLQQTVEIWQSNFEKDSSMKVPRSLSAGLAYRVTDFFLVLFDVQRVFYSDLMEDFIDFNGIPDHSQVLSDVTELHFGLENTFPSVFGGKSLTLRVGYWLDPYHAPLNDFDDNQLLEGDYAPDSDIIIRDTFFLHRFASDTNHYNAGFGLGWNPSLHWDFAIDYADEITRYSLGGTYRMGK